MIIRNDAAIPADLRQCELKVDGELWLRLFRALPEDLAVALERAVKSSEPMLTAIRQYFAEGHTIEGVQIRRRSILGSAELPALEELKQALRNGLGRMSRKRGSSKTIRAWPSEMQSSNGSQCIRSVAGVDWLLLTTWPMFRFGGEY